MTSGNRFVASILALLFCVLLACCNNNDGAKQGQAGSAGSKPSADSGIPFTKTTLGLPGKVLDYIGQTPNGLAGARPAAKVYYSVREEIPADIYCRDLNTGKRTKISTVDRLLRGSLVASSDGRYLAYSRAWEIGKYIDDPTVKDPAGVAVIMRLDTQSGQPQEVFNFREGDWRKYRADAYSPFISADGKTIMVLGYDYDQALLLRHLSDWIKYADDFDERKPKLTQTEIDERIKVMRDLTLDPRVAPKLTAMGTAPSTTGPIPAKERQAMQKLLQEARKLDLALLVWQDGKSSIVPLKLPAEMEQQFPYIVAAGTSIALLSGQSLDSSVVKPQKVFCCELGSGAITPLTTIPGPASSIQLSADEQELLAIYNVFDSSKSEVQQSSSLLRVPLTGGEPANIALGHDFLGFADMLGDGSVVVGQDQDDQCLYRVNTASGESQAVSLLLGPVDGVFIAGNGEYLAYLEKGVLFSIAIPQDPEQSPEWITEAKFETYKQPITSWLAGLGYTLPADLNCRWEERDGMGAHEVAVEMRDPAKPDLPVMLRYDAGKQQPVSLWFVQGYPFPFAGAKAGQQLDYYACKAIADAALDQAQWLPGETKQVYQPGPNPVYDGKSKSYIITYRDGYWLGKGDGAKWAFNQEATVRVSAADGQIAEMTLVSYEAVTGQPLTITPERAEYIICNEGEMKIQKDMPIRFDTENPRLVVAVTYEQARGPAKYNAKPVYRLCYEIDAYLHPEDELILTSRVDTETGELMGQLNFMPSNIPLVKGQ